MRKRENRALLAVVGTGAIVVAMAIACLLSPFEPTVITHAQTPIVGPSGLPATGTGAFGGGGLGLAPWIALVFAGAVVLGVGIFLAVRRSEA